MSSFGVVFAPQAEVAAAELARVCRGRIGLTAWEPHPEQRIWEPYLGTPANTGWSSEEGIRRLLPGFELEFEHATWWLEAESGEAAWEWAGRAFPPMRERQRRLAPNELSAARRSFVELYESFRANGRVRYPRPYLLAAGSRR